MTLPIDIRHGDVCDLTDPGRIDRTIASVTSTGAGRPGISAVVTTMSCLAM